MIGAPLFLYFLVNFLVCAPHFFIFLGLCLVCAPPVFLYFWDFVRCAPPLSKFLDLPLYSTRYPSDTHHIYFRFTAKKMIWSMTLVVTYCQLLHLHPNQCTEQVVAIIIWASMVDALILRTLFHHGEFNLLRYQYEHLILYANNKFANRLVKAFKVFWNIINFYKVQKCSDFRPNVTQSLIQFI